MIKHVVLCKVKPNSPIKEIKEKIEHLKHEIDVIKSIEVGIDIGFDKNPSDFCIITQVDNIKDLEIYANHPKHLEVIEFLKNYLTERRAVDFEV